jgi:hypothetical protein
MTGDHLKDLELAWQHPRDVSESLQACPPCLTAHRTSSCLRDTKAHPLAIQKGIFGEGQKDAQSASTLIAALSERYCSRSNTAGSTFSARLAGSADEMKPNSAIVATTATITIGSDALAW